MLGKLIFLFSVISAAKEAYLANRADVSWLHSSCLDVTFCDITFPCPSNWNQAISHTYPTSSSYTEGLSSLRLPTTAYHRFWYSVKYPKGNRTSSGPKLRLQWYSRTFHFLKGSRKSLWLKVAIVLYCHGTRHGHRMHDSMCVIYRIVSCSFFLSSLPSFLPSFDSPVPSFDSFLSSFFSK